MAQSCWTCSSSKSGIWSFLECSRGYLSFGVSASLSTTSRHRNDDFFLLLDFRCHWLDFDAPPYLETSRLSALLDGLDGCEGQSEQAICTVSPPSLAKFSQSPPKRLIIFSKFQISPLLPFLPTIKRTKVPPRHGRNTCKTIQTQRVQNTLYGDQNALQYIQKYM